MAKPKAPFKARPDRGRGLFYTRDSGGKHDTTPSEYVRWAAEFCRKQGIRFDGRPEAIDEMIRRGSASGGDLFLDWDVKGNVLSRPGLDALFAEVARDRTVSHVLIPRRDRLAWPDEVHEGIALESRLRKELGVSLVFQDRILGPLKFGAKADLSESIMASVDYDRAESERRELARKMLHSQVSRARKGQSSGGRAAYGFRRWLIGPDEKPIRALEDGETIRRHGHHVVFLPAEDGTFEVRRRIVEMLKTTPATRIVKWLNAQNATGQIPPPDSSRTRTDNGFEHPTSGLWHATTVTNIGRHPMNAAILSYGRRSMGDKQRLGPQGPRDLEEGDLREDRKPKVVTNPASLRVEGPCQFSPLLDPAAHAELQEVLDRRAGTQRGKPRSPDPDRNPLGGRVFDMDCTWPMYRTPYKDSFVYRCGAYTQSHGARCNHNRIDGPEAARVVLACVQQQIGSAGRLAELRKRLEVLAAREADGTEVRRNNTEATQALEGVRKKLDRVSRNMALADTDEQLAAMQQVFEELSGERKRLEEERIALERDASARSDSVARVEAALKVASDLAGSVGIESDYAAVRQLFDRLNINLFVRFKDESWGKRAVRRPAVAVLTMGAEPFPIEPYVGPTGRRMLATKTESTSNIDAAEGLAAPDEGGTSLGNPNRGDRI